MKPWTTQDFFETTSEDGGTFDLVEKYTSKKCGYSFSIQMCGSFYQGQEMPQQESECRMLEHIKMFHKDEVGK